MSSIKPTGHGAKIPAVSQKAKVSKKGKTSDTLVSSTSKISKAVQGKIPVVKHTAQPYAPKSQSRVEKKIPKVFARAASKG